MQDFVVVEFARLNSQKKHCKSRKYIAISLNHIISNHLTKFKEFTTRKNLQKVGKVVSDPFQMQDSTNITTDDKNFTSNSRVDVVMFYDIIAERFTKQN